MRNESQHNSTQRSTRKPGLTAAGQIPSALKNFSDLPDEAGVRLPVVEGLFACSGATVWRRVKQGKLPAPLRLSDRHTVWNVGDLRRALACEQVAA